MLWLLAQYSDDDLPYNSVIFGRAIKNEYLALATLGATGLLATSLTGGKKEAAAPGKTTLEQVKETVKLNAGSRCVSSRVLLRLHTHHAMNITIQ